MRSVLPSYHSIQLKLGFEKELPYDKNWSASADFLNIISDHCIKTKPRYIFECSSGLTTLVLSKCCQLNQYGQVQSLENGKQYLDQTQHQLQNFQLESFADIIHAPLAKTNINDQEFMWYDSNCIPETAIDTLVIDGPPGFIQKHSRYPALPVLYKRLADNSTVFLDDASRDDEKDIIRMWLQLYPSIEHNYIDTDRGCSVLTIHKD